jgi:hypothetical protein
VLQYKYKHKQRAGGRWASMEKSRKRRCRAITRRPNSKQRRGRTQAIPFHTIRWPHIDQLDALGGIRPSDLETRVPTLDDLAGPAERLQERSIRWFVKRCTLAVAGSRASATYRYRYTATYCAEGIAAPATCQCSRLIALMREPALFYVQYVGMHRLALRGW